MEHKPIICVVGARPNFMKMAPILRALALLDSPIPVVLVHTGQHYDAEMNDAIFKDLKMPMPDVNLNVGSGTHTAQTAEVMLRFEPVLDRYCPSCVVVVGDVNSTLACSLASVKKNIPLVHVEAGLRSHDRGMPEEINRLLTDQISDRLYTTEKSAMDNLIREGIDASRVKFVGNVMIDSLIASEGNLTAIDDLLNEISVGERKEILKSKRFGLITLHRPSNVDFKENLTLLFEVFIKISKKLPLLFILHPRTRESIKKFDLEKNLNTGSIFLFGPQSYLKMLSFMKASTLVLTDSGGVQEETTALGIPCLTLRQNTERPVTVEQGSNMLVGSDASQILNAVDDILSNKYKNGLIPEFWDGYASQRIADDLSSWLSGLESNSRRPMP